jgi:hypothetical protein
MTSSIQLGASKPRAAAQLNPSACSARPAAIIDRGPIRSENAPSSGEIVLAVTKHVCACSAPRSHAATTLWPGRRCCLPTKAAAEAVRGPHARAGTNAALDRGTRRTCSSHTRMSQQVRRRLGAATPAHPDPDALRGGSTASDRPSTFETSPRAVLRRRRRGQRAPDVLRATPSADCPRIDHDQPRLRDRPEHRPRGR